MGEVYVPCEHCNENDGVKDAFHCDALCDYAISERLNNSIRKNEHGGIIIYMVMVFTKLEYDRGFPNFGSECTVGFYANKDVAFKAVKANNCDIWETCYDYAIIEEVEEGMYPCSTHRWLFKYNKDKDEYEQIEEPKWLRHFSGLVV